MFESAIRESELFTSPAIGTDDYAEQLVHVVSQQLYVMAPLCHGLRHPPKTITKWLSLEAVAAKRVLCHLFFQILFTLAVFSETFLCPVPLRSTEKSHILSS